MCAGGWLHSMPGSDVFQRPGLDQGKPREYHGDLEHL